MDTTPTRTSTAIAAVAALALAGLLLVQVPLAVQPALVGIGGAVAFAASLWLANRERWTTVQTVAVSLLTLPVAVGILVGTAGTVLLLVGAFFPVERTSQLSSQSLRLLARVGIVGGVVSSVFGVTLGVRNVVDRRTLVRHYWVALKTAVVPTVVGGAMVVGAILTNSGEGMAGPQDPVGTTVDGLLGWLFTPGGPTTHLATLLALLAVAAVALRDAVRALPIAELLEDSGAGETRERSVEVAETALGWIAATGGISALFAFVIELATTPAGLADQIGPGLVRQVYALTTAPGLRTFLVGLIALAVLTVLTVWLLRRLAQGSAGSLLRRLAPVAGGTVLTVAAVVVAEPVLRGLLRWIEAQLPTAYATPFRETTTSVFVFYGPAAIVVTFVAVLVVLTAAVVLTFRGALVLGYLSGETAGFALASGGLFLAAALAGVIEAPTWLVFAGLVGSLLVWDTGRYGTVLGREIGRRAATRNAELVHAGGTVAVGVLGVGAAVAIRGWLGGWEVGAISTATAALAGVLAGIVLLVAALR